MAGGLSRGRAELNGSRTRLGLPPLARVHGGISAELCIVGTFPQLEYPRPWPSGVHVAGPLLWEPPYEAVEPPPGEKPLVLVAPSTSQDPEHRLLRAALAQADGQHQDGLALGRLLLVGLDGGDLGGADVGEALGGLDHQEALARRGPRVIRRRGQFLRPGGLEPGDGAGDGG